MKRFVFRGLALAMLLVSVVSCSTDDGSSGPVAVPDSAVSFSYSLSSGGSWFENDDSYEATLNIMNLKASSAVKVNSFKMLIDGTVVQEVEYADVMKFKCPLSGLAHGYHEITWDVNVSGDDYLETDLPKCKAEICIFNEKPALKIIPSLNLDLWTLSSNGEEFAMSYTAAVNGNKITCNCNADWMSSNGERPEFQATATMRLEIADDTVGDFEIASIKYHWNNLAAAPADEYVFTAKNPFWFDGFSVYPEISVKGEHEGIDLTKSYFMVYNIVCGSVD